MMTELTVRNPRTLDELAYRLENGYSKVEQFARNYEQEMSLEKWRRELRNSIPTPWQRLFDITQALKMMKRIAREEMRNV